MVGYTPIGQPGPDATYPQWLTQALENLKNNTDSLVNRQPGYQYGSFLPLATKSDAQGNLTNMIPSLVPWLEPIQRLQESMTSHQRGQDLSSQDIQDLGMVSGALGGLGTFRVKGAPTTVAPEVQPSFDHDLFDRLHRWMNDPGMPEPQLTPEQLADPSIRRWTDAIRESHAATLEQRPYSGADLGPYEADVVDFPQQPGEKVEKVPRQDVAGMDIAHSHKEFGGGHLLRQSRYTMTNKEGKDLANFETGWNTTNPTALSVDAFGALDPYQHQKGMLGAKGVLTFIKKAIQDHPTITKLTSSVRLSGARTGGHFGGPGAESDFEMPLSENIIRKALAGGPSPEGAHLLQVLDGLRGLATKYDPARGPVEGISDWIDLSGGPDAQ